MIEAGREIGMALRRLRRRPRPVLMASLGLALGIGAATATYSAVRDVLLRPLPVEAQDDLVVFWQVDPVRGFPHVPLTPTGLEAVRAAALPLVSVAGYEAAGARPVPLELPDGGGATVDLVRVAADFFGTLGAQPHVGRLLRAEDDLPGAAPAVVLGHAYWASALGGDPGVVGSVLRVGGRSYEVVGIARPGLDVPLGTQAWVTLRGAYPDWASQEPVGIELDLLARVDAGTNRADLGQAISALVREHPASPDIADAWVPVVTPLDEALFGSLAPLLWALLAAALVLVATAAANAVLVLLSGSSRLVRELAIRRALGSPRASLFGRVLGDAGVAGLFGLGGGLLLASVLIDVVLPLAPAGLPRLGDTALGWGSAGFAAVLACVVTVVIGSGAAWLLARADLLSVMQSRGEAGSVQRRLLFRAMATVQVGLAVIVTVGAGLLARTVVAIASLDPGFAVEGVSVVTLRSPHPIFETPASHVANLEELTRRLESSPGVASATLTINTPLVVKAGIDVVPRLEGQAEGDLASNPFVGYDAVLPNYFDAMGVRVLEGRTFEPADRDAAEVPVVVSREAARLLWPGRPALGRRLSAFPGYPELWGVVVGVVEDTRYRSLLERRPALYVPFNRLPGIAPSRVIVQASTVGGGPPLRGQVEAILSELDSDILVTRVERLADIVDGPLVRPRFGAVVLLVLSGATLLLAALGVYGVFTVLVGERTREMGVRKAVGARAADLVALVGRDVLALAGVGAAGGMGLSLVATRGLSGVLFGVGPTDPVTLAGAALGALALALAAGALPALRAGRAEAVEALRSE